MTNLKVFAFIGSFSLLGIGVFFNTPKEVIAESKISMDVCQYNDKGCVDKVETNMCPCETEPVTE